MQPREDYSGTVSIVIPVYNSEHILPDLISCLNKILPTICSKFEVILVNDGSQDSSWNVITRLSEDYRWVRGFNLMRNYGENNALLCGIRSAKNEIIVTMDDDLQHPPSEISKLISKLIEGYDVVYGTPRKEEHGLFRNLASVYIKRFIRVALGISIASDISSFRAFRTILREAFANYKSPNVLIDVLLTWGTTRFATVSVRRDKRRVGRSNYTMSKLIVHVINMITGFSTLPLRVASIIGFSLTFIGIIILIYVIGSYLIKGADVPGFTFLASIITVFSGAQLFSIGIIGEYLGRMHSTMMERPVYVVREETPD